MKKNRRRDDARLSKKAQPPREGCKYGVVTSLVRRKRVTNTAYICGLYAVKKMPLRRKYTDGQTNDYQKCKEYCDEIINSGAYALSTTAKNGYSGYEQVFMGDNDENEQAMKEIIFPIRQDGKNTREYSGSTMLVSSMRIAGMPYSGTSNYWSCYFSRKNLVEKFFSNGDIPMAASDATAAKDADDAIVKDNAAGISTRDVIAKAGDDRALFYMGTGGGIRALRQSGGLDKTTLLLPTYRRCSSGQTARCFQLLLMSRQLLTNGRASAILKAVAVATLCALASSQGFAIFGTSRADKLAVLALTATTTFILFRQQTWQATRT